MKKAKCSKVKCVQHGVALRGVAWRCLFVCFCESQSFGILLLADSIHSTLRLHIPRDYSKASNCSVAGF